MTNGGARISTNVVTKKVDSYARVEGIACRVDNSVKLNNNAAQSRTRNLDQRKICMFLCR